MTVESTTYTSGLNASYPASGDGKVEGDDHIRLIKSAILATWPNVAGAVTASHAELNYVVGVTSAIQTQINTKAPSASPTLTGTPLAPTATLGTNTTQIATTEYVDNTAMIAILPTNATYGGNVLWTNGTTNAWKSLIDIPTYWMGI